jgi:hypothetical protein
MRHLDSSAPLGRHLRAAKKGRALSGVWRIINILDGATSRVVRRAGPW